MLCGDGLHRFLPLPAASVLDEEIAVASALALIDERHVDFYRDRAKT